MTTEYTVTRLASSRFRINVSQRRVVEKRHMIVECPTCALPFGLHAMGYAADQPFIVDGAGVGTAVPGVVMDLECLPIDKREMFQRQFQNELIRWKLGDSEWLLRIFSTNAELAARRERQRMLLQIEEEELREAWIAQRQSSPRQSSPSLVFKVRGIEDEARPPTKAKGAPADVIPIASKRRMFDDD